MQHRRLDFADEAFDPVVCPLGLSLVHGARPAAAEWRRVTKPGGSVASSAFAASARRPLADLYADQLFEYGLTPGPGAAIMPWRRFAGPKAVSRLLLNAGFAQVKVVVEQLGSFPPDAEASWDFLTAGGVWLDLPVVSVVARK